MSGLAIMVRLAKIFFLSREIRDIWRKKMDASMAPRPMSMETDQKGVASQNANIAAIVSLMISLAVVMGLAFGTKGVMVGGIPLITFLIGFTLSVVVSMLVGALVRLNALEVQANGCGGDSQSTHAE